MITNNYTSNERYQIADTIWQQLGSQRFSLKTGCKPLCYGEKDGKVFLLISVKPNVRLVTLFEVAYNEGTDLYDVCFMRKMNGTVQAVANYNGIYCDMLQTLFTNYTKNAA